MSRFPVEYWTHPIVRDGVLEGAICTFFDVTEKRRAQDELEDAQRRKDEFLATLAHELRNPLAPLRNGLEIMRKTRPDDAQSERLRAMMVRQLGQLTRLVDDILDVSRMTHGKIALRKEPLDLRDAARAAVDSIGPAIAAKGQRLSVDTPESPIHVDGDAVRLTQVLMNLLDNASKYTPPQGRIELALSHGDEAGAVIFVRDTGNDERGPGHRPDAGEAAGRAARRQREGSERRAWAGDGIHGAAAGCAASGRCLLRPVPRQTQARPRSMSQTMSSKDSSPMDRRTMSGGTPAFFC